MVRTIQPWVSGASSAYHRSLTLTQCSILLEFHTLQPRSRAPPPPASPPSCLRTIPPTGAGRGGGEGKGDARIGRPHVVHHPSSTTHQPITRLPNHLPPTTRNHIPVSITQPSNHQSAITSITQPPINHQSTTTHSPNITNHPP